MEGSALLFVGGVEVDSVPEVEKGEDNVLLGCKVEGVESSIVGEVVVDLPLFYEVFDEVEMTVETGVEESSETLVVLLVHPDQYFLVLIFLKKLFFKAPMNSFFSFLDKESYKIDLSLKGELVEYGILLAVFEVDDIKGGMLLEVLIDLIYFAIVEKDLYDFALFASLILSHIL